jgi:hypothetical protein
MASNSPEKNSQGTKRALSDDEQDTENDSNIQKTRRTEPEPESEITIDENNWPQFLLMSATDSTKPLTAYNSFLVSKSIHSIASENEKLTRLSSGSILIEVSKSSYCEILLKTTFLPSVPVKVKVTPHKTLNTSRGVIRSSDINMCNEKEILEGFQDQGVIEVKCLTRKTPHGIKRSGTYFLTFNTPNLPEFVDNGYRLRIPVKPFIPNPLRCFKCQKFGHGQSRCRRQQVCGLCAEQGHEFSDCSGTAKCVNCKGDHPSAEKTCPSWLYEKSIMQYSIENKCSFKEAREINPPPNYQSETLASIVKKNLKKDASTQTDIAIQVTAADIAAETGTATQTASAGVTTSKDIPQPKTCEHCPHCNPSTSITQYTKTNSDLPKPYEPPQSSQSSESNSQPFQTQKTRSQRKKENRKKRIEAQNAQIQNAISNVTSSQKSQQSSVVTENPFSTLSQMDEMDIDSSPDVQVEKAHDSSEVEMSNEAALNQACFTADAAEELSTQGRTGGNKPVPLKRDNKPPRSSLTDEDRSGILDAIEGFGQTVMDRPLPSRSVPVPLKRDNKLPTS